jgi:inositol 1,4,5-triphosphate receptor type 1/inositol 1,4,5-triphosphate receptor type 3
LDQQESTFTDEIIRVLNVSVIIKKIQERNPTSKWLKHLHSNLRQEQLYEIMELLHSRIRNIEIVYQGKTMVVFYPSHPLFEFLSAHTTELILFKVNRVSQREKILGLLEQREILFYELEYNYALNQMQIPITQRKIDLL